MPFRKLQDILFFLPCLFLSWIAVNQGFSSFTLMINIYLPFIWESHTFCTGVAKFRVIIRLRRQYRPGTPEFCYSVPGPPDVLPSEPCFPVLCRSAKWIFSSTRNDTYAVCVLDKKWIKTRKYLCTNVSFKSFHSATVVGSGGWISFFQEVWKTSFEVLWYLNHNLINRSFQKTILSGTFQFQGSFLWLYTSLSVSGL